MKITLDELEEIFAKDSEDQSGDNVLDGLILLSNHFKRVVQGASHDEIYCADIGKAIEILSADDCKRLRNYGFHLNHERECIAHFV